MTKYSRLRYKINVLAALKDAGYSTGRIRAEKIMGEQMVQKIRKGEEMPSCGTIEILCKLLKCQPGDIVEYVPEEEPQKEEAPDAVTSEAGE